MPPSDSQLILLLAVPSAAAIVIATIARFTARRGGRGNVHGDEGETPSRGSSWPARLAPPLAISLGPAIALVFGTLVLKNTGLTFSLHPLEPFDWFLFTPLAALIVGVAAVWLPSRFTALVLAAAGAMLALCLSVRPGMKVVWELWPAVAVPAILFGILEPVARRNRNPAMPIILLLLAGSATVVKLDSTSRNLGLSCIPLAAALVGLLVSYPLLPDRDLSRAALPAFTLLWSAMLIYGYFWADVPGQRIILLAAYAADFPPTRRLRPFWRATCRVALVAIPLSFAVVPAARDLQKQINHPMEQDM